ncbi:MAG: hypothetical protein ACKPKO_10335, partial [Candidatus Fonsibacter sp.]
VLKHKYQVKYISIIAFSDYIYCHINRDNLKKLYEQDALLNMAYRDRSESSNNDSSSSSDEEE